MYEINISCAVVWAVVFFSGIFILFFIVYAIGKKKGITAERKKYKADNLLDPNLLWDVINFSHNNGEEDGRFECHVLEAMEIWKEHCSHNLKTWFLWALGEINWVAHEVRFRKRMEKPLP